MVSLWPFKADSSAATFEKALSTLATKIERASAKIDNLRRSSRRVKAMWTLYTTFAYIFALLILTLVIGWENWQVEEYGAVAGSPIIIFGVRYTLSTYYSYRISSAEAHLSALVKERDDTIEKLKAATKYNSIKNLVEKYGDEPGDQCAPPSRASPTASGGKRKASHDVSGNNVRKTNFKPPPTANIPVNRPPQQQPIMTEQQRQQPQLVPTRPDHTRSLSSSPYPSSLYSSPQLSSTSLSPNTNFKTHSQYPSTSPPPSVTLTQNPRSHWYDRILDVLLGEDETQPKNRFALICTSCRLVNGQAPPGTRQLSDIGRWRCGGCGNYNGVENEAKSLVAQIKEDADGGEGATDRRERTTRNRVEMVENSNYDRTSSNQESSGDDYESDNKPSHSPNAGKTVTPGPETDPIDEPESETLRDLTGDENAPSTGHSRDAGQKEISSVRSTRSKRKKNKS